MLIESLARKTTTNNEGERERKGERVSKTADSMIYGDYSTSLRDFAFSLSLYIYIYMYLFYLKLDSLWIAHK